MDASFKDVIVGYKFCVTMSPDTPLKYLLRHGEVRPSIPPEENVPYSAHFIWIPEVDSKFKFLGSGMMASPVGPIPVSGGDYLPYLIELRQILEKPRDYSMTDLDDIYARATTISKIESKYARDKEWALSYVFSDLEDYSSDGLSLSHIEELYGKGYKSILEILRAPDCVLLSLKGIGRKKLEKIRANKKTEPNQSLEPMRMDTYSPI